MNSGPGSGAALGCAILLLGYALQIRNGHYSPYALLLVAGAAACTAFGLVRSTPFSARLNDRPSTSPGRGRWVSRFLAPARGFAGVAFLGLAVNLALMVLMWPGIYLAHPFPQDHPAFLATLGVASGAVTMMVWDCRRARRLWFPVALLSALAMGLWLIHASPQPKIDVITVHEYRLQALKAGNNPYAMTFPNIYADSRFYGAGMALDGTVLFGFPYPPLSLFMAWPSQLWLGDVRYAELGALLIGAGLIGAAPRASAADAKIAPLAASLLLFTPRTLFVLEQGWTEAFAICWLGASVYAACRVPRALPWTLALLVSAKQYLVLVVPFSLLLPHAHGDTRGALKLIWPSLVVPLLLAAPFLAWNAHAFTQSVVLLQLREPFRADSLSLLGALAATGWPLARHQMLLLILPLVAVTVAAFVAWRWAERSVWGFWASLAFCLLLVFLTGKKAFGNYYYFVIAALCAAAATWPDCAPRTLPSPTADRFGPPVRDEGAMPRTSPSMPGVASCSAQIRASQAMDQRHTGGRGPHDLGIWPVL